MAADDEARGDHDGRDGDLEPEKVPPAAPGEHLLEERHVAHDGDDPGELVLGPDENRDASASASSLGAGLPSCSIQPTSRSLAAARGRAYRGSRRMNRSVLVS
jgi:hypothetical protein